MQQALIELLRKNPDGLSVRELSKMTDYTLGSVKTTISLLSKTGMLEHVGEWRSAKWKLKG